MQIFLLYMQWYVSVNSVTYFACRHINGAFQCFESYAQRCMTEETRRHIQRLYSTITPAVKKLCQPGPYQDGRWPYGCVQIGRVQLMSNLCLTYVPSPSNPKDFHCSEETSAAWLSDLTAICVTEFETNWINVNMWELNAQWTMSWTKSNAITSCDKCH
jgi:hypothetical protein